MPKGLSVHIGLNHLNPNYYGNVRPLNAAVQDALDWEKFAKLKGFSTKPLRDAEATTLAFKTIMADWEKQAEAGDLLLITYSGHGDEMQNNRDSINNDENFNQTWCLFDKEFLDDEIYECLSVFKEGIRIVVVSDSCHSGTVTKAIDKLNIDLSDCLRQGLNTMAESRGFLSRNLPQFSPDEVDPKVTLRSEYTETFNRFQNQAKSAGVKASVKLLAACLDDQVTYDGKKNGIFTKALMSILEDGKSQNETAERLIELTQKRYESAIPTPHFFQFGSIIETFDLQSPFEISIPDATLVSGYRAPDFSNIAAAHRKADREAGIPFRAAVLKVEIIGNVTRDSLLTGKENINIVEYRKESDHHIWQIELSDVSFDKAWESAHALQSSLSTLGLKASVEPLLSYSPVPNPNGNPIAREMDGDDTEYKTQWPPAFETPKINIGWHLDAKHSELADARDFVLSKNPAAHIRIAHIDTGYIEGHPSLPKNLRPDLGRNFVDPKRTSRAIDGGESGQDGHGLGTIILLAGDEVRPDRIFNEFTGEIGGVPFAEVLPIRISESVPILNTDHFCNAVQYAIDQKCEVIAMSMAGKPSRQMAKKVNEAYEAGIVMVTAASNCWYKGWERILPKCVLYPAAFHRVIAAVGANYEDRPYDGDFIKPEKLFKIDTKYMQGCWGPDSRMTRALAAYTPNMPWATIKPDYDFTRDGAGTSSAVPQIAAAAALWIAHNREELQQKGYYDEGNKWMKVEAVRRALFDSAEKPETAAFSQWKKYYGNGILRARKALDQQVAAPELLNKSPEAESSVSGLLETAAAFFKNRPWFRDLAIRPPEEALADELLDLMQVDPTFVKEYESIDLSDHLACTALLNDPAFRKKVQLSEYASGYLQQCMTVISE